MNPPIHPAPPRGAGVLATRRKAFLLCAVAIGLAATAAADEAVPVVGVTTVTRQDLARDLSVQGEFRPYQEIELHAKIAGYLQSIDVDIGDRVKAGQVIATLEVPELKQDLDRCAAAVQRAAATYKDAHLEYTRLQNVTHKQPNLVAQGDLDAAAAKDAAAEAAVAEAKAELERFRTLDDYTRITAPFAGVITKRFADPGALIQAGTSSNTQAMPIVRLSENDRLRLDYPISVSYAADVMVGDPVTVQFDGNRPSLFGTIARFSREIAVETRTMLGETDVPNPKLTLIPGMYVTVALKVDRRPKALAVPVEAVSGTAQPTVYVVNGQHQIEERHVKLGIETPANYEVLSGLKEGELVMIGNRSEVHVGQTVTPKQVEILAAQ